MNDPSTRRSSKRRAASPVDVDGDGSKKPVGEIDSSAAGKKKERQQPRKSQKNSNGSRSVESSRAPTPLTTENAPTEDPMEYIRNLEPLPATVPNVAKLTKAEREELQNVLEFKATDDDWKKDWVGNLAFAEKEILNPSIKSSLRKSFRQPFLQWVINGSGTTNIRLLRNLMRYICNMDKVPVSVKKLLGSTVNDTSLSFNEVVMRVRRSSYDPQILREDGWVVDKSAEFVGATGGPYCIGDNIRAEGADAVVIAYVHDPDIGDLWKAMWVDDLISFDLEAEELLEARKKWERRYNNSAVDKARRSVRISVSSDFTVKGVEFGVVLAASYSKGARPGVYWPARIMHASEADSQGRRNSSKQKVDLVFLAPYWDTESGKKGGSMSESGQARFDGSPLLLLETIDATDETIKEYPYSMHSGLDVTQLQMSFRFTGLPKSAFNRYLDAHRLAMALREYALRHLKSQNTATDKASAGLFETHPMSVEAPTFPPVILHLPFSYILSQLPRPNTAHLGDSDDNKEPVLQLNSIVSSMKPPFCWGKESRDSHSDSNGKRSTVESLSPMKQQVADQYIAPGSWLQQTMEENGNEDHSSAIGGFMTTFPLLNENFNRFCTSPSLVGLLSCLTRLLAQLAEEEEEDIAALSTDVRQCKLSDLITSWTILKSLGEESLASHLGYRAEPVLVEWRRAVEKIYKYVVGLFSDGKSFGIGVSCVVTDMRCNGHRTTGCFERPVRLPAALKGARMAGAGRQEGTRLICSVPEHYVDLVEQKLLAKTHDATYLKRMKSRCENAKREDDVLVLTDDSDGEGGEDTRKCLC